MFSFGFLNRGHGGSGGGGSLNIVNAEVSQDGTKVIITYDGTPTPYAYDINIMIGGVTDGNLAANVVGNSIEWVVLNTIKTGDVVTVNIMAQGNIGQVNNYPVTNLSIIAAGPIPTALLLSAETDVAGQYVFLAFDINITGTIDKANFVVSDGFGSGHTVIAADYLDEVVRLEVQPLIQVDELTMIVNFIANANNNLEDLVDEPITNMVPVSNDPANDVQIDSAFTSTDGLTVTALFNGTVTGAVTIDEIAITSDQQTYSLGSVVVLDDTIEVEVSPYIESGDTNIVMSFTEITESNIDNFTDQPVANTVPAPAPEPDIDLDGDGLVDTVIYENGNITITEDDDSYNVDLNGDGIEDIHVDK